MINFSHLYQKIGNLHTRASTQGIASGTALVGLYLFALSIDLSTAGANIGLALIILASLPMGFAIWKDLCRLPIFWIALALTVYVLGQSAILVSHYPILDESSNPHWSHVARVTGLLSILIGWWLTRLRTHVSKLLLLVAVSIVVSRVMELDIGAIVNDGILRRTSWGSAPVKVGYLAGAGAVLSLSAIVHHVFRNDERNVLARYIWLTSFSMGFAICTIILYGSQTRGAWLGTFTAVAFLIGVSLYKAMRYKKNPLRLLIVMALSLSMLFGLIALVEGGNILERRIVGESKAIEALLSFDREALYEANRSVGLRVNMWTEALSALEERPWFGYGVGSKPILDERSDTDIGGSTGHLHSIYIELLFSLGIVGALGFIFVYCYLFTSFIRQWRNEKIPEIAYLVLSSFWIMTLVTLLTDVRIGHSSSRALIIFMTGLLCTASLVGTSTHRHLSR